MPAVRCCAGDSAWPPPVAPRRICHASTEAVLSMHLPVPNTGPPADSENSSFLGRVPACGPASSLVRTVRSLHATLRAVLAPGDPAGDPDHCEPDWPRKQLPEWPQAGRCPSRRGQFQSADAASRPSRCAVASRALTPRHPTRGAAAARRTPRSGHHRSQHSARLTGAEGHDEHREPAARAGPTRIVVLTDAACLRLADAQGPRATPTAQSLERGSQSARSTGPELERGPRRRAASRRGSANRPVPSGAADLRWPAGRT